MRGNRNGQVTFRVYKSHLWKLPLFLRRVILRDAQGVNPDVMDAKGLRNVDGILIDLGQITYWQAIWKPIAEFVLAVIG
jgi:hypothetical protein